MGHLFPLSFANVWECTVLELCNWPYRNEYFMGTPASLILTFRLLKQLQETRNTHPGISCTEKENAEKLSKLRIYTTKGEL